MNPYLAEKLVPFGTTVFHSINLLAQKHQAIPLAQGFPNFPAPDFIKEAAIEAIRKDHNQYGPPNGVPKLRQAIAHKYKRFYDLEFDRNTEISVFSGCTEAIYATCMGILNPGDEVLLFEPFYDSYRASVAMAGGITKCTPLQHPDYGFDMEHLQSLVTDRTRMIFINTPHNPTGKVYSKVELEALAKFCIQHDLICITDEVYEHLVFDDFHHIPMASLPGMRERTLTLNSTGKTFSLTGWKIGTAVGPEKLIDAVNQAHQFITFCSAIPLQHGVTVGLEADDSYFEAFVKDFTQRRDYLVKILQEVGFKVQAPQGTYFVMADFTPFGFTDDVEFCTHLIESHGVAGIPPTAFYEHPEYGRHLMRFSFSKTMETLEAAGERLRKLKA